MPSLLRHPLLARHVVAHPLIFALGWAEAYGGSGVTYDDDPWSSRSLAYDCGRDLRLWGRG